MISSFKLTKLARKWQSLSGSGLRRKRISWPQVLTTSSSTAALTADKGHFFVYSAEGKCFMIPLVYLQNQIVKELLQAAEEEFGVPSGPIKLPCDAILMEYAFSLIQRRASEDLQKALVMSIPTTTATGCCLSSSDYLSQEQMNHRYRAPICSYS
ncbi:hypothetical protein Dimus_002765 [Dionaea muscipula]